MADPDLYQTLGVQRGASEDEIRKSYRKLARQYHPDVNPNDSKAEERFKEISFAYDVLSDAEKRKRYDEFGTQGLAEGFDPAHARSYQRWQSGARRSPFSEGFASHEDLGDLFGDLFRQRRGPARGGDLETEASVDFLSAVRGEELRLQIPGSGTLRVQIPAGSDEGTRVRLAGKGQAGRDGGPSGDLLITLHVRPHPFYKREGSNLNVELPVTLKELVEGGSVEVPTPGGPVQMTIPPGSQNGQRLRLRGKGVPDRSGSPGDLFVKLVIQLPKTDDPRLSEIAEQLEELYGDEDVRRALKTEK